MKEPIFMDVAAIPAGSRILLYGAGGRGQRALELITARGDGVEVTGFVDTFRKESTCGLPTYGPEDLPGLDKTTDLLLLCTYDFVALWAALAAPFAGKLAVGVIPMPERRHAIILHEFKAIYLIMPKVASSAIERSLAAASKIPPEVVQENTLSDGPALADFTSFSFVRNPWHRICSLFGHRENNLHTNLYLPLMRFLGRDPDDFANFVDFTCLIPDPIADIHIRSQRTLLTRADGVLDVDFIGKFESVNKDFTAICQRLGIPAVLPSINPLRWEKYDAMYTGDLADRIARRYALDIETFGYTPPRSDKA